MIAGALAGSFFASGILYVGIGRTGANIRLGFGLVLFVCVDVRA